MLLEQRQWCCSNNGDYQTVINLSEQEIRRNNDNKQVWLSINYKIAILEWQLQHLKHDDQLAKVVENSKIHDDNIHRWNSEFKPGA